MAEPIVSIPGTPTVDSGNDKDKSRKSIDHVMRGHEHVKCYWPIDTSKNASKVFLATGTKWKVAVKYQDYQGYFGKEYIFFLTLVGGAEKAVISYDVYICERCTIADNDSEVYWSASNSVCANLNSPISLEIKADCSKEISKHKELACFLSFKIFETTAQVPIPNCSLVDDIQSTIANREEWQDVILKVGPEESSEEIKANKFMLVARSPVFARMFNTEMKEKEDGVVIIPDIHPDVCKEMLSFIYSGTTNKVTNLRMAKELMFAAEKYELLGLKLICENRIAMFLSVSNAAHILSFASMYCGKELKEEIIKFITRNNETCAKVMKTEGWKEVEEQGSALMTEIMAQLVTADNLGLEEPSAKRPRLT